MTRCAVKFNSMFTAILVIGRSNTFLTEWGHWMLQTVDLHFFSKDWPRLMCGLTRERNVLSSILLTESSISAVSKCARQIWKGDTRSFHWYPHTPLQAVDPKISSSLHQ